MSSQHFTTLQSSLIVRTFLRWRGIPTQKVLFHRPVEVTSVQVRAFVSVFICSLSRKGLRWEQKWEGRLHCQAQASSSCLAGWRDKSPAGAKGLGWTRGSWGQSVGSLGPPGSAGGFGKGSGAAQRWNSSPAAAQRRTYSWTSAAVQGHPRPPLLQRNSCLMSDQSPQLVHLERCCGDTEPGARPAGASHCESVCWLWRGTDVSLGLALECRWYSIVVPEPLIRAGLVTGSSTVCS